MLIRSEPFLHIFQQIRKKFRHFSGIFCLKRHFLSTLASEVYSVTSKNWLSLSVSISLLPITSKLGYMSDTAASNIKTRRTRAAIIMTVRGGKKLLAPLYISSMERPLYNRRKIKLRTVLRAALPRWLTFFVSDGKQSDDAIDGLFPLSDSLETPSSDKNRTKTKKMRLSSKRGRHILDYFKRKRFYRKFCAANPATKSEKTNQMACKNKGLFQQKVLLTK